MLINGDLMRRSGCVLTFVYSLCILAHIHATVHPCNRKCVEGVKMDCDYNFTVEWYRTLSKACHSCPFLEEDCFRPHCVTGDGTERAIITVNRQVPGPSIEVCEGDTVIVWVENMMDDGTSVTIHWHGVHQKDTQYMDGVPHITQCDINYKQIFRYEFMASPAGTHMYHSHTGLQMADGLAGPIIIRRSPSRNPNSLLYEHDLSEHVVSIMDWLPVPAFNRYLYLMHKVFDPTLPVSGLINGRTKWHKVLNRFNVVNSSIEFGYTPRHRFIVQSEVKYRFRSINMGGTCPFKIAIDDHMLIIIALDGHTIQPVTVQSVILHPGERVDFVLHASRPVGHYWFRAMGMGDCSFENFTTFADLSYAGSSTINPEEPSHQDASGMLFNPIRMNAVQYIKVSHGNDSDIEIDQVRSTSENDYSDEIVDQKFYIGMEYYRNDNTKFNHPTYYPVKDLPAHETHFTPVMNYITFDHPPIPLLSQPEDVNENWFCNESTVNIDDCQDDLCLCTHRIIMGLGKVIELILVDEGTTLKNLVHPMHMHGYSFRVLGMEKVGSSTSRAEIEDLDKRGLLKRNLVNPPLKDTVAVPNGGYVILRFVANNPGLWFFHCHTASHLVQGKALIIQVGDQSDLPPIPTILPRCGGYGFSNSYHDYKLTATCSGIAVSVTFLNVVVMGMLFLCLNM